MNVVNPYGILFLYNIAIYTGTGIFLTERYFPAVNNGVTGEYGHVFLYIPIGVGR